MRMSWLVMVVLVLGVLPGLARAQDVLELRDGTLVRGRFMGGTQDSVRFEGPEGLEVFERGEVLALTFGAGKSEAQDAPPPRASAPAQSAQAPTQVVVPSGTTLLVRMDSTVSTKGSKKDERFQATLVHDLAADGVVIAPAGTKVYGRVEKVQQAGRLAGKSELKLRLREIDIGGQLVRIKTGSFSDAGQSSFRKTARNAGLGAGIGAAFGDGDGAAKGAAIGGAVSILREGDAITVPTGAMLEFRLRDALVHKAS